MIMEGGNIRLTRAEKASLTRLVGGTLPTLRTRIDLERLRDDLLAWNEGDTPEEALMRGVITSYFDGLLSGKPPGRIRRVKGA